MPRSLIGSPGFHNPYLAAVIAERRRQEEEERERQKALEPDAEYRRALEADVEDGPPPPPAAPPPPDRQAPIPGERQPPTDAEPPGWGQQFMGWAADELGSALDAAQALDTWSRENPAGKLLRKASLVDPIRAVAGVTGAGVGPVAAAGMTIDEALGGALSAGPLAPVALGVRALTPGAATAMGEQLAEAPAEALDLYARAAERNVGELQDQAKRTLAAEGMSDTALADLTTLIGPALGDIAYEDYLAEHGVPKTWYGRGGLQAARLAGNIFGDPAVFARGGIPEAMAFGEFALTGVRNLRRLDEAMGAERILAKAAKGGAALGPASAELTAIAQTADTITRAEAGRRALEATLGTSAVAGAFAPELAMGVLGGAEATAEAAERGDWEAAGEAALGTLLPAGLGGAAIRGIRRETGGVPAKVREQAQVGRAQFGVDRIIEQVAREAVTEGAPQAIKERVIGAAARAEREARKAGFRVPYAEVARKTPDIEAQVEARMSALRDRVLGEQAKARAAERVPVEAAAERPEAPEESDEILIPGPRAVAQEKPVYEAGHPVVGSRLPEKLRGPRQPRSLGEVGALLQAATRREYPRPPGTEQEAFERAVRQGYKDLTYQLKQPDSGIGWYREDVRQYEHAARQAFPELEDPGKMSLFKIITAATSPGNKPLPNAEIAFRIWERFRKSGGELPDIQRRIDWEQLDDAEKQQELIAQLGEKKGEKAWEVHQRTGELPKGFRTNTLSWPGSGNKPGKGMSLVWNRLRVLHKRLDGDWDAVAQWLKDPHPISELRQLNLEAGLSKKSIGSSVAGMADAQLPGIFAFGPKVGPFGLNLHGFTSHLTADMWFSRTWNRWMGTVLETEGKDKGKPVDAPRTVEERALQRRVIEELGRRFRIDPADAQAALWYYEQNLWDRLGVDVASQSYASGGRTALESRRLAAEGKEPKFQPPTRLATVAVEVVEPGVAAPYRERYAKAFAGLAPKARAALSRKMAFSILQKAQRASGVEIQNEIHTGGGYHEKVTPNVVVEVRGSDAQIKAFANLLGLGAQQTEVAVSRDLGAVHKDAAPPTTKATKNTTLKVADSKLDLNSVVTLAKMWDGTLARLGADAHLAGGFSRTADGIVVFKGKIEDAAWDGGARQRVMDAITETLRELDAGATIKAQDRWSEVDWYGHKWEEGDARGEGYRAPLREVGFDEAGIDHFDSGVRAGWDVALHRAEPPARGLERPPAGRPPEVPAGAAPVRPAAAPGAPGRVREAAEGYGGREVAEAPPGAAQAAGGAPERRPLLREDVRQVGPPRAAETVRQVAELEAVRRGRPVQPSTYAATSRGAARTDSEQVARDVRSRPVPTSASGRPVRQGTLGNAVASDLDRRGYVDIRGQVVRTGDDAARLLSVFRDPRMETFRVVGVKADGTVAGHAAWTSRLVGAAVVPWRDARLAYQMARWLRRVGADGYFVSHNHPGVAAGQPVRPTADDVARTKEAPRTVELGGRPVGFGEFKGHVVIDHSTYALISPDGRVTEHKLGDVGDVDPLLVPSLPHPELLRTRITQPEHVAALGSRLSRGDDIVALSFIDGSGRLRGIHEVPLRYFYDSDSMQGLLRKLALEFGGARAFAYLPAPDDAFIGAGAELMRRGALDDAVHHDGDFVVSVVKDFGGRRAVVPAGIERVMQEKTPYGGPVDKTKRGEFDDESHRGKYHVVFQRGQGRRLKLPADVLERFGLEDAYHPRAPKADRHISPARVATNVWNEVPNTLMFGGPEGVRVSRHSFGGDFYIVTAHQRNPMGDVEATYAAIIGDTGNNFVYLHALARDPDADWETRSDQLYDWLSRNYIHRDFILSPKGARRLAAITPSSDDVKRIVVAMDRYLASREQPELAGMEVRPEFEPISRQTGAVMSDEEIARGVRQLTSGTSAVYWGEAQDLWHAYKASRGEVVREEGPAYGVEAPGDEALGRVAGARGPEPAEGGLPRPEGGGEAGRGAEGRPAALPAGAAEGGVGERAPAALRAGRAAVPAAPVRVLEGAPAVARPEAPERAAPTARETAAEERRAARLGLTQRSKPFEEQRYPFTQPVRVTQPDGSVHEDEVKGLNRGHALARARANWPGAEIEPIGSGRRAERVAAEAAPYAGRYWEDLTEPERQEFRARRQQQRQAVLDSRFPLRAMFQDEEVEVLGPAAHFEPYASHPARGTPGPRDADMLMVRRPGGDKALMFAMDLRVDGKPLVERGPRLRGEDDPLTRLLGKAAREEPAPYAPPFYSPLARAAEKVPQAMRGADLLRWLSDPKREVKKDHLYWSGVEEWLKSRAGEKVTPEELREFVESSDVRVTEEFVDKPQYEQYTEPGGRNYRELLLTLPQKKVIQAPGVTLRKGLEIVQDEDGKWNLNSTLGTESERGLVYRTPFQTRESLLESARTDPELTEEARAAQEARDELQHGRFHGGHYTEPDVLAHIRLTDRVDADGKKVLFIEEVQSDWAQKGRREGFEGGPASKEISAAEARLVAAREAYEEARSLRAKDDERAARYVEREFRAEDGADHPGIWRVYDLKEERFTGWITSERADAADKARELNEAERRTVHPYYDSVLNPLIREVRTAEDALHDLRQRLGAVPRAPFVEDTEKWTELALKRVLKYAADNDYERVAWTTGEQQNKRYDLSKQIDALHWRKYEDGTYSIIAMKDARDVFTEHDLTPERLVDYVGKDVADRIIAGKGKVLGLRDEQNPYRALTGLDLTIGGKGMRGYYDEIVPQVANKIAKRFGAKAETATVGIGKMRSSENAHAIVRTIQALNESLANAEYERRIGIEKRYGPVSEARENDARGIAQRLADRAMIRLEQNPEDADTWRLIEALLPLRHVDAYREQLRTLRGERPDGKLPQVPVHSMTITPQLRKSAREAGFAVMQTPPAYGPQAAPAAGPPPVHPIPGSGRTGTPEPGGQRVQPGSQPRVEENVERLERAEQAGGIPHERLDRETAQRWDALDPEVKRILINYNDEDFYRIRGLRPDGSRVPGTAERTMSPAEVMAWDARVRSKAEKMLDLEAQLAQARRTNAPTQRLANEHLQATADFVAAERLRVNDGTGAGRALAARARVMNAGLTEPSLLIRRMLREIPGITEAQAARLLQAILADPAAARDLLRAALNPSKIAKALEWWKAGLLSSPKTDVANFFGNSAEHVVRLMESMAAPAIETILRATRRIDPNTPRVHYLADVGAELRGNLEAFGPALRDYMQALLRVADEPVLDTSQKFDQFQTGAIGGTFGKIVRYPFRRLEAMDRFFKAVGGRGDLRRMALQKARTELGRGASAAAVEARYRQIVADLDNPTNNQHADILERVRREQLARTFQQDPPALAAKMQEAARAFPGLQLIAPFIKTPANITAAVLRRTPLIFVPGTRWAQGETIYSLTKALHEGKLSEAEYVRAVTQPVIGSLLLGLAYGLTQQGNMTGSGPTDFAQQKLKKETGWSPYSFVFDFTRPDFWDVSDPDSPKTYIPFNRFEPISSLLGMAADIAEGRAAPGTEPTEKFMGSIAENLLNKSYFTGLSGFGAFLADPQREMSTLLTGYARSAVPNIIGTAAEALEPTQRDVSPGRTGPAGIPERAAKTIASRIPFVRSMVPERRTATGEVEQLPTTFTPLSRLFLPTQMTQDKPGKDAERMLIRIGYNPPSPRRVMRYKGVDVRLDGEEYEIWKQASIDATEQLRRLVASGALDALPDFEVEGGDASKEAIIRKLYNNRRTIARKLLSVRPGFRAKIERGVAEQRQEAAERVQP